MLWLLDRCVAKRLRSGGHFLFSYYHACIQLPLALSQFGVAAKPPLTLELDVTHLSTRPRAGEGGQQREGWRVISSRALKKTAKCLIRLPALGSVQILEKISSICILPVGMRWEGVIMSHVKSLKNPPIERDVNWWWFPRVFVSLWVTYLSKAAGGTQTHFILSKTDLLSLKKSDPWWTLLPVFFLLFSLCTSFCDFQVPQNASTEMFYSDFCTFLWLLVFSCNGCFWSVCAFLSVLRCRISIVATDYHQNPTHSLSQWLHPRPPPHPVAPPLPSRHLCPSMNEVSVVREGWLHKRGEEEALFCCWLSNLVQLSLSWSL